MGELSCPPMADEQTERDGESVTVVIRPEWFGFHHEVLTSLDRIERKVGNLMAAQDDLTAAVAALQAASDAENTEMQAAVAALGNVQTELAAVQQQLAAGGTVSDADIESVVGQLATVTSSMAAATAAASAVTSPPATDPTDPTGGTTRPAGGTDPTDPTGGTTPPAGGTTPPAGGATVGQVGVTLEPGVLPADGTSTSQLTAEVVDTTGAPLAGETLSISSSDTSVTATDVTDNGDGTYSAQLTASQNVGEAQITVTDGAVTGLAALTLDAVTAPTDPAAPTDPTDPGTPTTDPGAPAAPTEDDRSLYTFDGDPGTVDPSVWPTAPYTTPDGAQLYYYSGDTAAGQSNGDGLAGQWHVYVGSTVPSAS